MAKTLDDLQTLLTSQGLACELKLDAIVATRVKTKTYKNPAGENALEILLTFDRPNRCVAVEILQAFDLRATDHKEATLACVMTASGRTPLLRPGLEPEGDIKIRIDCPCDADGAEDERVLEAVAVLTGFAEAWHPQVAKAMKTGKFNAHEVARLNLFRFQRHEPDRPADGGNAQSDPKPGTESATEHRSQSDSASIGSVMRAAAISTKPGGHPSRLAALAAFRRWLDDQGNGNCEQN